MGHRAADSKDSASLGVNATSGLRLCWAVAAAVALVCHWLWHAHGIRAGGFQNLDVAGIAYNARLLLAGRLPYIDSIEIKPPGAFLLFAPWLALGGMKAVWLFSVVWAVLTSLGTGWLGALCWGAKWGPRIAVLHAAGAAVAADGDINYSFWMTLPFVLSAAFSVRAAHSSDMRAARWSWFASAAMGTFAVLVRPSALTAVLVFVAAMFPMVRRRAWREVTAAVVCGLVGVAAVTAVIALPFMRAGNLQAMVHGYVGVRQYANESVSSIVLAAGGRLSATLVGLQCLPDQLPVYHLLLAVALLPSSNAFRGQETRKWGYLAWVFAAASFVGISLTLRFFTHDNAPIWPALVVLALRPTGILGQLFVRMERYRHADLVGAFTLGVLAPLNNWQSLTWLQRRLHESDAQVERLCTRLAPHLSANDTVLAWGWNAWGVYEHCGRWAPGPVYKDLTTVTTPNTNTCNRGYDPPRLKRGPFAARYLQDLKQQRPALILVSDYYRGLGGDPLDGWFEARHFIRDHYVVYEDTGSFLALLRRDLGVAAGLPSDPPAPFTESTSGFASELSQFDSFGELERGMHSASKDFVAYGR